MKTKDFRIGWRTLVQEPAYSLVVILGLGIGLAASLLLFGFVRYSLQYNAHVPDVDNVYVIKQRFNVDAKSPWFDQSPLLLRNAAARVPGVIAATGYIPTRPEPARLSARIDNQLRKLNGLTVLPGFAHMFGVEALQGSLDAALTKPDSFAITEEAAIRLFGTANALGRTMVVEGKLLRVGAVVRTPPANTTVPFETLLGVDSVLNVKGFRDELLTGAHGWWGKLLVRVHPDASLPAITAALQQVVDGAPALQDLPPEVKERLGDRKVMDLVLSPLRDAYFDREVASTQISRPGDRADPVAVAGLGAIALLILALAAINYVNLAAVRVLRRQREVAMRKVLGASVRQIVLQLLAESMLVAMVATGLGLLLAWLALPLFAELVNRKLDGVLSPINVAAAIMLGILLGLLTAAYPAWIAIRVRPSQVLAGRADTESRRGMQLRRVMTVMQVSTAMGLASMAVAVAWQTDFAMRAAPGFDPAPLLVVDIPEAAREDEVRVRGFIAELSAQPGIAGVARTEDAVGRNLDLFLRDLKRPGGASASAEIRWVSTNFFEQYRIKPEAGRLFDSKLDKESDQEPIVLNAIAARELGFATPEAAVGQAVLFSGDDKTLHKRVIGIAPELRFQTLREAPRAAAYELAPGGTTLSVRAAGSPHQLDLTVKAIWFKYFPDFMYQPQRAKDILSANYADDARMAKLLAIATGIALAIAAFGTYVLAAHTVQRRAREIVLRKLHGARRADIGLLVVREIGGLTLVAALVGLPLAAVAIQRYLATYVEHAPIGYWPILFALVATLAIALAAVARQAWIAMRMMPSEALRI
jgi:ABC-type antimicrobial peptide transport system permease subunit